MFDMTELVLRSPALGAFVTSAAGGSTTEIGFHFDCPTRKWIAKYNKWLCHCGSKACVTPLWKDSNPDVMEYHAFHKLYGDDIATKIPPP